MGLDTVEFVMALEDAFGVEIANEEAETLATPRDVVDHMVARLPPAEGRARCHSQRAFHRLRSAVLSSYRLPRKQIRRDTPWMEVLPHESFGRSWRQLQVIVGTSHWPRHSVLGLRPAPARTIGATAEYMARKSPVGLKGENEGWTRAEIEGVVRVLIADELGITSFSWDDRFVEDLRVD